MNSDDDDRQATSADQAGTASPRAPEPASHRTALNLFVASVTIAGIAVSIAVRGLTVHQPLFGPSVPTLVVLCLLLVMGEVRTLKWLKLHDGGEVTASWAFAFALLILPAPTVAVIAMAGASVIGDLVHRKPLQRVAFNGGQTALSLSVAALVLIGTDELETLAHDHALTAVWFVAIALAGVAMFLTNSVLTCIALALHEGTKVTVMLRRGLMLNFLSDVALVALAPIFVVVAARSVFLLPLVVVVALMVHINTRSALANEHEANHDVLTELWNRRAFTARISSELGERDPDDRCALVLVDLDDFKDINDRLGHHVGDAVLAEVGSRLRSLQRPGHVAARLGGDEFAVLITRLADEAEVLRWADELRASLAQPYLASGFPVASAASVGVAMWPVHGRDEATLFQAADLAMYAAKKSGNSVQLYKDSVADGATGRVDLLAELERGLEREELEMWYQPQLDLATGRPVAMEALIRWRHPRLGLVMPSEFVPVAEHTELIVPLTEYALDRALRDAARWQDAHPEVRVAVNASARNLNDLGFPKVVSSALEKHRYEGSLLELEITENTVLSHPEKVAAVLGAIEPLGVRLCIDDFGTGYSSLTSLRDLPVETIKIDRSFVRDLPIDAGDEAIVRGIIDLAHNLGLTTVAEGVDSTDASNKLVSMGCDLVQGYLIARPMPLDEAVRWLDRCVGRGTRTTPPATRGPVEPTVGTPVAQGTS
ncbi:MAG: bifunctional diguanylate cyclase/phosphodiesterase [Acidimicrobiales bacterium]